MEKLLMGVDIGTSACKVAVFSLDGELRSSSLRTYPIYTPAPFHVEQDAEHWWAAVCEATQEVLGSVDPASIAGVGVAGQSWSMIPITNEGEVFSRVPIWMDTRADYICKELKQPLGDALFAASGNPLSATYTLPKVLHFLRTQPEMMQKAYKILQSNSFIVYRLTGNMTQDTSQGYGYQVFDQQRQTWDTSLCEAVGLPMRLLPPLCSPHEIVGHVTKSASLACGLLEGTPVVAGGLDAACGTLGAGVIRAGQTQEQGGTSGGMSICMEQPCAHKDLIMCTHVVPGRWLLQGGMVGGGGVLKWFAHELGAAEALLAVERDCGIFDVLSEEAGCIPAGSDGLLFLPYMAGERSPVWDPKAQGIYFGLGYDKTRAHMVRAAMEGCAYALQDNLLTAQQTGAIIGVMRAMGGSANSHVWTQIKSDVTGKAMQVVLSQDATALGAAMLVGVGLGLYRDFEDAAARTVHVTRTHLPDETAHKRYMKFFSIYQQLYAANRDLMAQLCDTKEDIL